MPCLKNITWTSHSALSMQGWLQRGLGDHDSRESPPWIQSCLCSTSSIVPSMAPQRELNSQDVTTTWLSHHQHSGKFRSTNSWSNNCMLFTKDKCGFRVRCSTRNPFFFVRMEREREGKSEWKRLPSDAFIGGDPWKPSGCSLSHASWVCS